jgi:AcrR family transcriptional regulator
MNELSTEDRIKQAAKALFQEKGYSGTRTRDIAERSGINLALLNYYFRSKQKLFELVMLETIQQFFGTLPQYLNNPETSLDEKIQLLSRRYIDFLKTEPDLPLFILSEIRHNASGLIEKMNLNEVVFKSVLAKQYAEAMGRTEVDTKEIYMLIINPLSLIIFPFVARPMVMALTGLDQNGFDQMMEQRKTLIPIWNRNMLNSDLNTTSSNTTI